MEEDTKNNIKKGDGMTRPTRMNTWRGVGVRKVFDGTRGMLCLFPQPSFHFLTETEFAQRPQPPAEGVPQRG